MTGLDSISALAALALALSLATERIITILKTLLPVNWLAEPPGAELRPRNPQADWARRIRVQLVAVLVAWVAASFLPSASPDFLGQVAVGSSKFPVWLLALMSSGGSAFWTSILNMTSSVKDLRAQEQSANAVTVKSKLDRSAADQRAAAIVSRHIQPQF